MVDDALESALRALKHRDRSAHELDRRLAERGFEPGERQRALETLERTGLLDDGRFARHRAESLAARGAGDFLIRHDLSSTGIDSELVDEAIDLLEPEFERARRIVEARGSSQKTARYLHGRGYSSETVTAAVATGEGDELR